MATIIFLVLAVAGGIFYAIFTSNMNKKMDAEIYMHNSKMGYLNQKLAEAQEDERYKLETIKRHQEQKALMVEEQRASIRQAQRIQTAVFTQQKALADVFPEAFIFTKTHSIVSGDLYKVYKLEHFRIFALGDCAGCGIPGGFLSMLGIALLNEQLSIHYSDSELQLTAILSSMRDNVTKALSSGSSSNVNDGMNMTLCAFSNDGDKLYFAGAAQNLYICHSGTVRVINGDKHPVGWYMKGDLPYTQHEDTVEPGDMVYLTTDSLQSQFGGPNNQKFTHKRLIQLMEKISTENCETQKQIVHKTVYDWIEGYKQIDDLTLAGVRV